MKIVFFGTSKVGLATLQALCEVHNVVAVVTSPDAPVGRKKVLTPSPISTLAQTLDIKTFKPEKVKNNSDLLKNLQDLSADVYIVVSYGKILPKELIEFPPLKTLNIHFSLLPKYRGAAPIQASLLSGDIRGGTTIFILDELLDHGPIIVQKELAVDPSDTFTTLAHKMSLESTKLLLEVLPKYASGQITSQSQDHTKASHAPMIKKEDGKIDWKKTSKEIHNMHRAYIEWPGIFTYWNGKLLKILDCTVASEKTSAVPGTVLPKGRVACGAGTTLKLNTIQLEGKAETALNAFLHGNKTFTGSTLV